MKEIITYKGFNADMKCFGDFQYEEGKEYETDETVKCCYSGFHSCIYPLDVLEYYPPYTANNMHSLYYQTIASGKINSINSSGENSTKIASSKIKIEGRLSYINLIKNAIEFIFDKIKNHSDIDIAKFVSFSEHTSEYRRTILGTKNRSYVDYNRSLSKCAIVNIGNKSAAIIGEDSIRSIAAATGDKSIAKSDSPFTIATTAGVGSISSTSNDYSISVASGTNSASYSEGSNSASISTGSKSIAISTGFRSITGSTSDNSVTETKDSNSIAVCSGYESSAIACGSYSIAANTGNKASTITNSDNSVVVNTGHNTKMHCKGESNIAVSTGSNGEIVLDTPGSIAVCTGLDNHIKGVKGSYFLIKVPNIPDPILYEVDGETIKENTWYYIADDGSVEESDNHSSSNVDFYNNVYNYLMTELV